MTNLEVLRNAKVDLMNALESFELDKTDTNSINIQTSLYQSYLTAHKSYFKEENKVKSMGYDVYDIVEILRGDKKY